MPDADAISTESITARTPRRRPAAVVIIIAVLTGLFGLLCLVLGGIFLIDRHIKVNADLSFDLIGRHVIVLHRVGGGLLLFGVGAWFAVLTWGLWRGQRYGRIMGWVTLATIALIAILLAVS
jgi:hypothetical protein